jgi:hypothetical protein
MAAALLSQDLAAWRARAAARRVDLDHGLFVALRDHGDPVGEYEPGVLSLGSRFAVDDNVLASPSSTDFRSSRHVTIVFPTDEVLSRLELLFRYGMNQSWMFAPPPAASSGGFEI